MPVRTNIGKISSAISKGMQAYDNIDFSSPVPPNIAGIDNSTSDWGAVDLVADKFIAGAHKWGSLNNKIAK